MSAFRLLATDTQSSARVGELHTDHGTICTPIFMPVGTQATVKAVLQEALARHVAPDIILANTYHLHLRPGAEVLEGAGGLHRFMNWPGPILTDSGGYQVYSLSHLRKITPEGVRFASHIDGSRHLFTPESVIESQRSIGSDIMMLLDECPPYPSDYAYARRSLDLTHQWARQAKAHLGATEPRYGHHQLAFGIVQGSTYDDLRKESCAVVAGLDFEGNAIGGLAVGEPEAQLYDLAALCCQHLPATKPRYLMGVGTPWNLLNAIAVGVDMFDCVMPTRNARHGLLFYRDGIRNLKQARYKHAHEPLDPQSTSAIDQQYSKAYLHHLFKAEEVLAYELASLHNLHFYLALVREARQRIQQGTFAAWHPGLTQAMRQRPER